MGEGGKVSGTVHEQKILKISEHGYKNFVFPNHEHKQGRYSFKWEAWRPPGWCARLWSERSGFEPWPGTLCCVLGQDTLLSQWISPPRCINGYW